MALTVTIYFGFENEYQPQSKGKRFNVDFIRPEKYYDFSLKLFLIW